MKTHQARKRFGQNFLQDASIIHAIIAALDPALEDNVVEIGPGLGAITTPLLNRVNHLQVVELDRDLVARLERHPARARLTLHQGDALQFDFAPLGMDLRIVGNLPYNISSPLLFHLAEYRSQVRDMLFMLQKEVVDRMVAEPNSSDYGRLSVMLQYRFIIDHLFDVPPEAFSPAPKVQSAIVRLIPLPAPEVPVADIDALNKVVTAAFSQRRKTLKNTLAGMLDLQGFIALGIDPKARAENLSVADFCRICNYLHA